MYSTQNQRIMAEGDSQSYSSGIQQKKVAESGSTHTAQGLSKEDG